VSGGGGRPRFPPKKQLKKITKGGRALRRRFIGTWGGGSVRKEKKQESSLDAFKGKGKTGKNAFPRHSGMGTFKTSLMHCQ